MATTRHVAFLRTINVGGRNITMAALKWPFEQLGVTDVETFIASGNVVFRTRRRSTFRGLNTIVSLAEKLTTS